MFSWLHDPRGRAPLQHRFRFRRASEIVRGLRQGLSEDERYAVADHVVSQLKEQRELLRRVRQDKAVLGLNPACPVP